MTEDFEYGTKMTFLSDKEAEAFLKKYDKIILLESKKKPKIHGITTEDMAQECRMKLLAGFHLFDKEKSSEKTWVLTVVKRTLNGILNQAFRKKRTCSIIEQGDNNTEIPVRDYSFERYKTHTAKDKTRSLEETYTGPPDGRSAFGTTSSFTSEDYLLVLEALQFLKSKLPQASYEAIKEEIFPEIEEQIHINPNLKVEYEIKEVEEYNNIWTIFTPNAKESEIKILSQIADFFVQVLGFNKEKILNRTSSQDIKLSVY